MGALKENKYALGNLGGRPPHYETPEELDKKVNEYLLHCIEKEEKPTITGMTLFVGFSSRASWDDYQKRDGFSYIVKRAKLTVENSYEQSGGTIDIFALKNMGWKDRTEIDQTNTNLNSNPISLEEIQQAKKNLEDEV